MNNFFLDTNIVIDVLLSRKPFVEASARLFHLAETGKVKLYISALSYWNIYYIIKKGNSHKDTLSIIKGLNNYISAVEVTQKTIDLALESAFNDFEDAIQYYSALSKGSITAIITRNSKDFRQSNIPILDPEHAINLVL